MRCFCLSKGWLQLASHAEIDQFIWSNHWSLEYKLDAKYSFVETFRFQGLVLHLCGSHRSSSESSKFHRSSHPWFLWIFSNPEPHCSATFVKPPIALLDQPSIYLKSVIAPQVLICVHLVSLKSHQEDAVTYWIPRFKSRHLSSGVKSATALSLSLALLHRIPFLYSPFWRHAYIVGIKPLTFSWGLTHFLCRPILSKLGSLTNWFFVSIHWPESHLAILFDLTSLLTHWSTCPLKIAMHSLWFRIKLYLWPFFK